MKLKPSLIYSIFILLTSCHTKGEERLGLKIEPYSKDFGIVNKGDTIQVAYLIRNVLQDTVKINKVNTGCGCTATEYPTLILPLQIDTLKVSYFSGVDTGEVEKMIVIESDKTPIFQSVFFKGIVQ
jgi:hypothetical protein